MSVLCVMFAGVRLSVYKIYRVDTCERHTVNITAVLFK